MYDFPVSVELTYLDVLSTRRQCILFNKYHNFLSLYNHSDFIKMHMHNAWLLKKSDLTIELPPDYFAKPKYLFVFSGTLPLNKICNNGDANTFDYHLFLFRRFLPNDSGLIHLPNAKGIRYCVILFEQYHPTCSVCIIQLWIWFYLFSNLVWMMFLNSTIMTLFVL